MHPHGSAARGIPDDALRSESTARPEGYCWCGRVTTTMTRPVQREPALAVRFRFIVNSQSGNRWGSLPTLPPLGHCHAAPTCRYPCPQIVASRPINFLVDTNHCHINSNYMNDTGTDTWTLTALVDAAAAL